MLTVIGEGLIDVVRRPTGTESHPGGSPLNVAVGLARLDHPVQFIGRYGDERYRDHRDDDDDDRRYRGGDPRAQKRKRGGFLGEQDVKFVDRDFLVGP